MRSILTAVFAAALIAAPAHSNAAPRSINDCEKIQAADAYNQCLALFGPLARGHGAAGDGVDAARQDAEAATGTANAEVVTVRDSQHGRRHASRHGWTRHSWARHGHWHRTGAAGHRHGKTTRMAFSVVSGHTRLR
ncbi:MAG TPA: hypothetical protein VIH87_00100 [Methylocella sp.]